MFGADPRNRFPRRALAGPGDLPDEGARRSIRGRALSASGESDDHQHLLGEHDAQDDSTDGAEADRQRDQGGHVVRPPERRTRDLVRDGVVRLLFPGFAGRGAGGLSGPDPRGGWWSVESPVSVAVDSSSQGSVGGCGSVTVVLLFRRILRNDSGSRIGRCLHGRGRWSPGRRSPGPRASMLQTRRSRR